ncbi:MAG: ParB N-terminal domain-containing protein [Lachnospiraceae bacterium]|jgi:ParB-like chromosome segregation protein Spo0J
MGSLSRLIKEKGGQIEGVKTEQVRVQQIHYTKLKESRLNFYTRSGEEVEELADTMIVAGGILQPLIVRKTDLSEYEILAGHKRRRASIYNVERGYKEYEFLPCIVIDMSGLVAKKIAEKVLAEHDSMNDDELLEMIAEYIVICTNSTASERSDYEKMMQAVRLSEILPVMLGNENLKGRALRAEIAKEMKCSGGQVGRYQSIYNNLVPEAMERFKTGGMVISTAAEMSGLDSDRQREALKKDRITLDDIRLLKQQEEHRETVSESDTEDTSLAAVPDVDTLKTAASSESEHIQSFGAKYTQEDAETVYREQAELVQQFEYIMSEGNMTAADYKRYKKALIIRDGISYILSAFGEGSIC